MAITWNDTPQDDTPRSAVASTGNAWFGIAMGLLGVIIGHLIGTSF
jgi:hypothetical protein